MQAGSQDDGEYGPPPRPDCTPTDERTSTGPGQDRPDPRQQYRRYQNEDRWPEHVGVDVFEARGERQRSEPEVRHHDRKGYQDQEPVEQCQASPGAGYGPCGRARPSVPDRRQGSPGIVVACRVIAPRSAAVASACACWKSARVSAPARPPARSGRMFSAAPYAYWPEALNARWKMKIA